MQDHSLSGLVGLEARTCKPAVGPSTPKALVNLGLPRRYKLYFKSSIGRHPRSAKSYLNPDPCKPPPPKPLRLVLVVSGLA